MPDTGKDYLAVIDVMGVGSWARDTDKETAIKNVVRIFRSDYKNYFKLPKGKRINISVLDVTGHDTVTWDCTGFYTKSKQPFAHPVETVVRTL